MPVDDEEPETCQHGVTFDEDCEDCRIEDEEDEARELDF